MYSDVDANSSPPVVQSPYSNRNVRATFIFSVLYSLGGCLWAGDAQAAYIYLQSGRNNINVGYFEGCSGLTQTVVAIPVALLIDRYRRDSSLRFSGFIGMLAIAATFYAFLFNSLVYLWPSLVLWGVFDAVSSPALESIFADSVATGSRSRVFSNKYIVQTVAGSLGPLLSVALFYYLGNNWSIETLRIVLLTGTGILVVPVFVLFSFSDDASLPEELRVDEAAPPTINAQSSPLVQRAHGSPLVTRFVATSSPARSNTAQLNERLLNPPSLDSSSSSSIGDKPESAADIARRRIPIWMALIDILIALGAGMTIKYFPLFFLEELALAPISVSLLFFISPLVTAIFTFCSTRLARHIGRAQTTLLSYVLGTGCLFAVALLPSSRFLLPIFVARTAFMNCAKPLERSILMDAVVREDRGKWNSLESLMSASWSGSAVLGGFLSDFRGYRFCFLVTGCVYAFACLLHAFFLVPLVPMEAVEPVDESQGC